MMKTSGGALQQQQQWKNVLSFINYTSSDGGRKDDVDGDDYDYDDNWMNK